MSRFGVARDGNISPSNKSEADSIKSPRSSQSGGSPTRRRGGKMQELERALDMKVPHQIVTITRWNKQRSLNEKLCNKLGNIVSKLKTRFDP